MSVYSKNLQGVNQRVFVSGSDIDYTTDATFQLFIDNAPEGELGVFLEAGTVKSDALAAGARFFVAQKRDGFVQKTPIIEWDALKRKVKTAYVAPVKQISYIGYAATGTADINFDFSLASSSNTLTFGVAVSETTPGNQPFPVQEGYVTVNSSAADEYTQLHTIVAQLNNDFDFQGSAPDRFVKAEIVTNGTVTYLTSTIDPTVTNGSRVITYSANVTVAAGAFVSSRGVIYRVTTGVTTGTSITIDRPYQGTSETIDVSAETTAYGHAVTYTSGTTLLGIKLTALNFDSHFKVRPVADLVTAAPTVTYTTAYLQGSGSYAQVLAAEQEGRFFDGVGSTINAAFAADYGQPTLFANATETYDIFILDFAPSVFPSAGLPNYDQKQIERLYIAAQSSGTSASPELATVFGL